jgi:hypothetical protein
LRIEIEQALRDLMARRGASMPEPPTIASMMQALEDLRLMPDAGKFTLALRALNSATHGFDLDEAAAREAFSAGKTFLAELHKSIRDT